MDIAQIAWIAGIVFVSLGVLAVAGSIRSSQCSRWL